MKKLLISIVVVMAAFNGYAQEVRVAEPEFINSYHILTSDTTFATLPKESGTLGQHQNKVKNGLSFLEAQQTSSAQEA